MNRIPFSIIIHRVAIAVVFVGSFLQSNYAQSAKETVLHSFAGASDGADPVAGLVADPNGNLYGTTSSGGNGSCQGGCGTVFKLSHNPDGTWTETQLYSFSGGQDGAFPNAGVVFDQRGNLYGATLHGGTTNDGTIFRLTPPSSTDDPWTASVLHNFLEDRDGGYCLGALTFDASGNVYGAAFFGGPYGGGTVFQLAKNGESWTFNVLHAFKGTGDGIDPLGAVILDKNGAVYGTTHDGTVFRLRPPASGRGGWSMNVLYRFGSTAAVGALLPGHPASLFGTTALGGANNDGTVFQLTPPLQPGQPWTAVTLYEFQGGNDGVYPLNGLVADGSGNLYGVTATGGFFNAGTAFKLSPSSTYGGTWTKTTVYNFGGARDGSEPGAGVILGKQVLYGTTSSGGLSGDGTVFQLKP